MKSFYLFIIYLFIVTYLFVCMYVFGRDQWDAREGEKTTCGDAGITGLNS